LKKKKHDTICEENATENGKGKLPPPFRLASEHNDIQGGMYNGEESPTVHTKEGIHERGLPPMVFVTPGKAKEKEHYLDPDINEFDDSFENNTDEEALEETEEERKGRERKEEENKNINKNLKSNEK
jgi:hypothetical protein